MTWETTILDWNLTGVDGLAVKSEQVLELVRAETVDQATNAYWKLDGLVCSNGLAYEASINVVQMILATLPICVDVSKKRCLELLGQISVCESDISSPKVVQKCLEELRGSSWYFLHGLQFDEPKNAWLYVDLIGVLGENYSGFKPKAISYLQSVLKRNLPPNDVEMIQNTLIELQ